MIRTGYTGQNLTNYESILPFGIASLHMNQVIREVCGIE